MGEIAQTKIEDFVDRKYKMKKKALVYSGQFLRQIYMHFVSQEYSGSLKNRCPLQTLFCLKFLKWIIFMTDVLDSHIFHTVQYNAF